MPPSVDENGELAPSAVFTGFPVDGRGTCGDWTKTDRNEFTSVGIATQANEWENDDSRGCWERASLTCFEK